MNSEKTLLELIDTIDLSEEEFAFIEEEFTDLDKKNLKRNLKNTILSKKRKKIFLAASFLSMLILSGTFLYKPAFADNIKFIQPIYEKLGYYKEYKDYTSYIGKSVEDKGYKFTVDNIVGTKNRMLIAVKIESKVPFPVEIKKDFMCFATSEGVVGGGGSGSYTSYFEDNKTLVLLVENESGKGYKKFGNLHINIHNMQRNVTENLNANFNFKVDFSKSFAASKELKTNKSFQVNESVKKINGLDSSILGTDVKGNTALFDTDAIFTYVLKVDDLMYNEISMVGNDDGSKIFFACATYDKIKNAKNISFIPIKYLQNSSERMDIIDTKSKNLKVGQTVTTAGIEHLDKVYFSDNRVGEFYKIQKEDNTIKVYFKGDGETLPFLTKLSLSSYYGTEKSDENINQYYISGIIYKDQTVANGYVKEFKVNGETNFKLSYSKESLLGGLLKTDPEVKLK